jgi:glucokinase
MAHHALGIDIGGTNTAFGLVNANGELLFEHSVPTRDFDTPEDLVRYLHTYLKEKDLLDIILGIGIGAPNGNYFTGSIEFAPNLHWKGMIPMAELFENIFHKPALLTNDANAAAHGEKLFGNAQDLDNFVTVTLGTGLGSGIVIDGELVYGHHGIAGEYGHIRVIPNGRLCGCGRKGCLETYASSTGVIRSIAELGSANRASSTLLQLEKPTAREVFEHAEHGDLFAQEIVDFTAEILGSALADFTAFSDPKAYVLFGGIAQSGADFAHKVKFYMEENMLNIYKGKVEIRVSSLHNKNAAVLGTAASLFWKTIKNAQK